MSEPLRLLLVEDSPVDAELNERELRKAGLAFVTTRVEEEAALVAALEDFRPDLILADYHLPGFDGLRALAICRERMPATPFIFVTGAMGEELAVESIKAGATDYILKDRLARLGPAARRALEERRTLVERTQAQRELSVSEERYHQLFEAMSSGVAIYRPDPVGESFTIQSVNRAVERIEGVARPDLLGRDVQAVFPGIESIGLLAALRRVARSGEPEQLPPTLYQDGRIRGWRQNYVYRLGTGDVVAVYEDVSERMEREAQIGRLNRTLRTITACDQDLVRMRCEDDLLQAICHDLVRVGQHLLVWVAYPDPDRSGGLRTLVTRGEPDLLHALGDPDSAAVQDGCGLARAALLEGRTLTWSGGDPVPDGLPPRLLAAGVAARGGPAAGSRRQGAGCHHGPVGVRRGIRWRGNYPPGRPGRGPGPRYRGDPHYPGTQSLSGPGGPGHAGHGGRSRPGGGNARPLYRGSSTTGGRSGGGHRPGPGVVRASDRGTLSGRHDP
jgi:CheY-like chemotaxis protein